MYKPLLVCCVITLVLINSAQSKSSCYVPGKVVCDFQNSTCLTRGMQNFFGVLLKGCKDLVKSINPLIIDERVFIEALGVKYEIANIKFSSLDHCVPELRFLKKQTVYKYKLLCSKLQLNAHVIAKGKLDDIDIDSGDSVKIIANKYLIKVTGVYGIFTATDRSKRFYLKEFTVDPEREGEITYESNNNFGLNEKEADKAKTYIRKNLKTLEKSFQASLMRLFMLKIVEAGDIYLRATPMGDVFPKYGFTEDEKLKCLSQSYQHVEW